MKKISYFRKALLLVTFGSSVLLIASCGYNQKRDDTRDVAEEQNKERFDDKRQRDDAQFLVNAAEINLKQIQLGQLAQQKGVTTHVKELGKMMEDAHTKSQRDLTALAQRKSITIPNSTTNDARDAYEDLNKKSGTDFDKAYAEKMVNHHEDAIDKFEKAADDSSDPDIRNWATASLRDMRQHLNHSIECKRHCDEL